MSKYHTMSKYHLWTTAALADEADRRLATVPGCAALPNVIHAVWPAWRLNPKRRAFLIEALQADDRLSEAGVLDQKPEFRLPTYPQWHRFFYWFPLLFIDEEIPF